MAVFEDRFSKLANQYARFRPQYPAELFLYLRSLVSAGELAWDCATGNGQTAVGLSDVFPRVIASDASGKQIQNRLERECVDYLVCTAERICLRPHSVDLVTVSQAVHWFDLDAFYPGVRRVLKPGGVLAVWCYIQSVISPQVNPIIARYYEEITGPYWPPRMKLMDEHYRTLPFPLEEIPSPEFEIETDWTLDQYSGFLGSWSVTPDFINARGHHPLEEIWDELTAAWGDPNQPRHIRWPLYMRVGRYLG